MIESKEKEAASISGIGSEAHANCIPSIETSAGRDL
jgi:hypothetical protein